MMAATTNIVKAVRALAVTTLFLAPSVWIARADDYTPGTGIAGTPHDFAGLTAGNTQTGACTFCHTPHKASGTFLAWNHTLPNTGYTWSDYTVTSGGTPLPTIQAKWQGPTKFCLSCHDGSVAIGDIGWFNGRSWTGAQAIDDKKLGGGDQFQISKFMNDMIGNHPVAAPYPYLRSLNTYNGVTTGPRVTLTDFNPDPTALGIRLFRNPSGQEVTAGASPGMTGIECTSCHGVHNEKGVVVDKPLLRGTKDSGAANICKKCHPNH
jgi:hypothetical protein